MNQTCPDSTVWWQIPNVWDVTIGIARHSFLLLVQQCHKQLGKFTGACPGHTVQPVVSEINRAFREWLIVLQGGIFKTLMDVP